MALVLSGSIGSGHDSVAQACGSALDSYGLDVATLDCMALLGETGSALGTKAFRRVVAVPSVYDGFHFSHLRRGGRLPRLMQRAADRRLVPAIARQLDGRGEVGLLVAVFPTGVSAAARLASDRAGLRTVVVCTDACAHQMWVADGIDGYVVCSSLAAATVRGYRPGAAIATVPPPVRAPFYDAPDQAKAREALGIPVGEPCVLVMAGGWGLGPLSECAEALSRAGNWVLAVAGTNAGLSAKLQRRAVELDRLRPFGFTERVPELMAAADVVVTSPGQACHEARVVGRPLVVLDVVPGHGRENALHEIEIGGALVCPGDPWAVERAVQAMVDDRPELVPWPVPTARAWGRLFGEGLESFGLGDLLDDPTGGRRVAGASAPAS